MLRLSRRLPCALALLLLPLACSDDAPADAGETAETGTGETSSDDARYAANIRRTTHGVAHVTADNWGSLAFGQAYAFTEDKGCLLADQIIKVRSERARWFGAGEANVNIYTDFAYLQLHVYELAQQQFPELDETVQDGILGYAAGYNQALAEGKIGGDCDGQAWVPTELDHIDLFAYYIDLGLLASSRQAITAVGSAQPPGGAAPADPAPHFSTLTSHRGELGSNGWAFGSDVTASGRGMVMGNPHFPWEGELQLWESHLRIPGEFEVYGVGLLGVPGVLIGFNEHVAWTHTVSDGHRLTLYQITSPPGEPTKYYYDGEVRDMLAEQFTIDVMEDDGTITQETRTMWRTHYGPMAALEPFYWTSALALSYRDANIDNFVLIEQFLRMNMSTSLGEFQQVHTEVAGIPWVNTMAASADGRAWYMDSTPTPNLSQAAIDAWTERKVSGFTKALADQDIWLLDGSDSRDEWQADPGARSPGLIAPANMPQLERSDFVFNANDSHWLSNPLAPLTGYSPLHGFEGTARSMRTRMNARTLLDLLDPDAGYGFAGADGKLDLDELTTAALANGGYTAQLLRDDLVARCTGVDLWDIGGGEVVDIAEACDLLATWDGKLDLDSVGAVIWREVLGDFDAAAFKDAGTLFATGFDVGDPVDTPHTLADGDAPLDALARAVQRLDEAGVALDAPLGEAQFTRKGGQSVPIHGGNASEGITNLITHSQLRSDLTAEVPRAEVVWDQTDLTKDGYQVNYGTSFIMCMEFTDDGPRGRALLSYSQSSEVDSGWYQDQTELFSQKQWRPMLWNEADIAADPNLIEYDVSGGEPLP
ncbi:penicillin acylase family protein [Enhygromyxa salina]|uniref:Aculeacin-A acylase n=1 Tax=Enhygromyxa salina TaxID=215803 RepID=A0A2S9YPR6_9BACT|nr:penicillin acylase family protein [Enhygromyxa salina]PRQ07083.1 Aculeacin-A acylase precursor [Enhygromyxa salina]